MINSITNDITTVSTEQQFIDAFRTRGVVLHIIPTEDKSGRAVFLWNKSWMWPNGFADQFEEIPVDMPSQASYDDPASWSRAFWKLMEDGEMEELGPLCIGPVSLGRNGYLDFGLPFDEGRYFICRNHS